MGRDGSPGAGLPVPHPDLDGVSQVGISVGVCGVVDLSLHHQGLSQVDGIFEVPGSVKWSGVEDLDRSTVTLPPFHCGIGSIWPLYTAISGGRSDESSNQEDELHFSWKEKTEATCGKDNGIVKDRKMIRERMSSLIYGRRDVESCLIKEAPTRDRPNLCSTGCTK